MIDLHHGGEISVCYDASEVVLHQELAIAVGNVAHCYAHWQRTFDDLHVQNFKTVNAFLISEALGDVR